MKRLKNPLEQDPLKFILLIIAFYQVGRTMEEMFSAPRASKEDEILRKLDSINAKLGTST